MADTQEIVQLATELGKKIAEHDASIKMQEATKKFQADADAQRLMTDFNRQTQLINQKQAEGKPIEVDDKHQLEKLQQGMIASTLVRDMQTAQMDYLDLMRQVDGAIQSCTQPSA